MYFFQLLCLFAAFLLLLPSMTVLMIAAGRKRVETPQEKRFVTLYYSVLMATFSAGGLVRVVQQGTGSQWQDGFVPIFAGMFVSLWGVPVLWRAEQNAHNKGKMLLGLLVGALPILAGLGIVSIGVYQVLAASR